MKRIKALLQRPYAYFLRTLEKAQQDHISFHAATLTFYTLFALVPFLGLMFGLAQGFGFESILNTILKTLFEAQEEVYKNLLIFTDNLLNQTKEQIIAGVGLIILLWSVYKVFYLLDHIFNRIWGISLRRSPLLRVHQFASIIILMPIVLVIVAGAVLYGVDLIDNAIPALNLGIDFRAFAPSNIKLLSFLLFALLFGVSYWGLPAIAMPTLPCVFAGLFASLLFHMLQWGYMIFQSQINEYGVVYGSFASVPLFMLWIYMSWIVYFMGAELAFILESKITKRWELCFKSFPIRIQHRLALKMMNLILNQFKNAEKPYNTKELSDLIGVPHSVTRTILEMLQSADLIIPTQQRYESAPRYVPAMSVDHLTKENILKSLENSGLGADQKDYGDLIEKME